MNLFHWATAGAASFALAAASGSTSPVPPSSFDDALLSKAVTAIQKQCFECHSAKEVKGGLRLDEVSGWLKTIDKDSPEDSELIYRMMLDADDGDVMPPKGPLVEPDLIQALQDWIEAGADEGVLKTQLKAAAARDAKQSLSLVSLAKDLAATIEPALVPGNAQQARGLRVSWSHKSTVPTAAQLAQLGAIAERTAEVNFAGTGVTDELLKALPQLPGLQRAHLERTAITDAGVATLVARAPQLRYLNLHSTQVSPTIREIVAPLAHLQQLVVFNTAAYESPPAHPFASIATQQPRRLLVVDAAKPRVVLLREKGIDTYTQLWESAPLSPEFAQYAQWIGDATAPDSGPPSGPADGHGRVLIQGALDRLVEIDTRTNTTVRIIQAPSPIHTFAWSKDDRTILLRLGHDGEYGMSVAPSGLQSQRAGSACPPPALAHGDVQQPLSSGALITVAPAIKAAKEAPAPQLIERNAKGQTTWTFVDGKRFPQGLAAAEVIERSQ